MLKTVYSLKITFLGTGTSQGVPVIACNCEVCTSSDRRDMRLRSSLLIETKGKSFVIDTGPDFRQQMLSNYVNDLSAVFFTHEHKDHVAGLDDVRPFNFMHKKAIPVYAEKRVQEALQREYAYIFADDKYPGIPQLEMHLINEHAFEVEGVAVQPIRVMHNKLPILGFRIENVAYLTDVKSIPTSEYAKLKGLDLLVINALRKEPHATHLSLDEALEIIQKVNPKQACLTHLSHRIGLHDAENKKLPNNIQIAYDGLSLEFD